MSWVVDTCVLIDIAEGDPKFSRRSAQLLDQRRAAGLLVAPVSYIELASRFHGVESAQNEFLEAIGVYWTEPWIWPDTVEAHRAWSGYMLKRGQKQTNKRPVADILIGAFASRFAGLLTRNVRDFRFLFPALRIDQPK